MHKKIWIVLCFLISYIAICNADYYELRKGLKNSHLIFEKTKKGRVAFMGGSITEIKGWKELVSKELQHRFPETKFEFIYAGIPSTGSTPGAFRLERDVFKNGPVDLLFEEAAVNDSANGRNNKEQSRAMEGIVRHARKLNPYIDIVLLYFADPGKIKDYNKGKTPQVIQNHELVAEHYKLPSINLAQEVSERIHRGEFTWEKDFKSLHPAPFGHQLYSATIARCFDASIFDKNKKPTPYPLPKKLDPYCYDSGTLLSPKKATGLKGFKLDPKWKNTVGGGTRPGFVEVPMLVGEETRDRFQFKFKGTAVGLFVAAGPDAGIIEFKIDNHSWKKQDLYTPWSGGLHIPWLYVLDAELDDKNHTLSVRISNEKNEKSSGHACRIVQFAVNT